MEEEKPKEHPEAPLRTVHTFQEDIAQAVKKDNLSVVKIALAENKKREKEKNFLEEKDPTSKKNLVLIGAGIILILAGLGIGFFFLTRTKAGPVATAPLQSDIINSDSIVSLNVSNLDEQGIARIIDNQRSGQIPLGTIQKINFVEGDAKTATPITTSGLFELLDTRIPDQLLRSFDDTFFFGIHSYNSNEPFLILKINSYQNAYAGMLQWEPYMQSDIGSLFINPSSGPAVISSSTASSTNTFVDQVIDNKDARSLVDPTGKLLFFYTFVDQNTLVFTTNQNTLSEILTRLLKQQSVH